MVDDVESDGMRGSLDAGWAGSGVIGNSERLQDVLRRGSAGGW